MKQTYENTSNVHLAMTTIRGKSSIAVAAIERIMKKDHYCIYTSIAFTITEGVKLSPSCRCHQTVTISSVFRSDDDSYLPLWLDAFCTTISKLLGELETDDEAIIFYDGDALRVTPENQQAP